MDIILSILQILGIVLLIVIALVIILVLAVLFVPIRYWISTEVHENVHLEGKITWLLHLFRVQFIYEDELLYAKIGILWKTRTISKEFGASEEDEEDDEKKKSKEKPKSPIKDKIAFVKKKIKQIKKLITDEKNKLAVKHLKDELIYLIKITMPKKSRLNAVFSTGSPDTTGQALGVLSWFPIIYQKNWRLLPDFEAEKAYFEGEFSGKGRIYVFQLVGILLRIMIDKNCRRLYYILKRLGGRRNGRRK